MSKKAKKDREIKEELLVGKQGYLRLPKRVRDNYGNPKGYPNPDCTVQESGGKLVVTYVFDINQLPKIKGSEKDEGGKSK